MTVLGANLENFTIDQFAGATALILGSLGGLLMIIWKSRCHCKFNLCYICQCERRPPPDAPGGESSDEEQGQQPEQPQVQNPENPENP
jgi:hypothetical protein